MISHIVYDALDNLAERHIPEGTHRYLHVNSREFWKDLIVELLEKGAMKPRLQILTKCAIHWEILLVQKLSILN